MRHFFICEGVFQPGVIFVGENGGNHVSDQIIATSHDLGPQKEAKKGKSPYFRRVQFGEILQLGQMSWISSQMLQTFKEWGPWLMVSQFFLEPVCFTVPSIDSSQTHRQIWKTIRKILDVCFLGESNLLLGNLGCESWGELSFWSWNWKKSNDVVRSEKYMFFLFHSVQERWIFETVSDLWSVLCQQKQL